MIRPNLFDFLLTRLPGIVWRLLCAGTGNPAPDPEPFCPEGCVRLQSPLTDASGRVCGVRQTWGRRGSLQRNGCGPLAAYNLLCGFGVNRSLPQVVSVLGQLGAAASGGRLGTDPARLAEYLRSEGCGVRRFFGGRRAAWKSAASADGLLILYRHPRGLHYVAAVRTGADAFTFWNDACRVPSPWTGSAEAYREKLRNGRPRCVPWELMLVRRPAPSPEREG